MSYYGGPPGPGGNRHNYNGYGNDDGGMNIGGSDQFYPNPYIDNDDGSGGGNLYGMSPNHPHPTMNMNSMNMNSMNMNSMNNLGMGMNMNMNMNMMGSGMIIPGIQPPPGSQGMGVPPPPFMQHQQHMMPMFSPSQVYAPNSAPPYHLQQQQQQQRQQQQLHQQQVQPWQQQEQPYQPQQSQPYQPQQPQPQQQPLIRIHSPHQPQTQVKPQQQKSQQQQQKISTQNMPPPPSVQEQPRRNTGDRNTQDSSMHHQSRKESNWSNNWPKCDVIDSLKPSALQDKPNDEHSESKRVATDTDAAATFAAAANRDDDEDVDEDEDDGKDDDYDDVNMEDEGDDAGAEDKDNDKDCKEGDDDGELTPMQAERELRRKKRRRLYHMLKKPGAIPSFTAVVKTTEADLDTPLVTDDDDHADGKRKQPLIIDVDEYLGLKSPPQRSQFGMIVRASTEAAAKTEDGQTWYEGVISPMTLPEDESYLSDLQQFIRANLELFSANEWDARMSQAGRRHPTVRGKVGIRCVHCARSFTRLRAAEEGKKSSFSYKHYWPPGSVSYPVNMHGLYSVCSQKPQQHFDSCPNIPADVKEKFKEVHKPSAIAMALASAEQGDGTMSLTPISRKRSRNENGISAPIYYTISAKRQGIVEVPKQGLRFSRNLSLAPLPFEAIRLEVEEEMNVGFPRHASIPSSALPVNSPIERKAADPESESCLESALHIDPDSKVQLLMRPEDRNLLTDFIFLTTAQMSLCHASRLDFRTRGKKTKSMRIGMAGFCCRFCCERYNNFNPETVNLDAIASSCRSFSSMPDNLASAISNSFVVHLHKCPNVPQSIKNALNVYKKTHSAQMQQLVFGSQRRLYMDLWNRMRAVDKLPSDGDIPEGLDDDSSDDKWTPKGNKKAGPGKRTPVNKSLETLPIETTIDFERENARVGAYPICTDESIKKILERYNTNWEEDEFESDQDRLMTPEWKLLVSDYVFLMMRQLKIAVPTPEDFRGNRRSTVIGRMAGMCCIYCNHADDGDSDRQQTSIPAGRSFPSAADNMASTLNSSLYNHMQGCRFVPDELKSAFVQLRKIHSAQCAALKFGSQRRFFNIIFDKLKCIPIDSSKLDFDTPMGAVLAQTTSIVAAGPSISTVASAAASRVVPRSTLASLDEKMLTKYNYVRGRSYVQCLRCRMVPFELRTPNSLVFEGMAVDRVQMHYHHKTCMGDGIDLRLAAEALKSVFIDDEPNKLVIMARSKLFQKLIRCVVGGHDGLTRVFGTDMFRLPVLESVTNSVDKGSDGNSAAAAAGTASADPTPTNGLWRFLPASVEMTDVKAAFEAMATEIELESTDLLDPSNVRFVRFLQLISPSLQIATNVNDEEKSAASPVPDDDVANAPNSVNGEINDGDSPVPSNNSEVTSLAQRKRISSKFKVSIDNSDDDTDGDNSAESDYEE